MSKSHHGRALDSYANKMVQDEGRPERLTMTQSYLIKAGSPNLLGMIFPSLQEGRGPGH